MKEFSKQDLQSYADGYDESSLMDKMCRFAGKIGKGLLVQALLLKKALCKDEVPVQSKLMIMGALAYLICPVDLIPDFIPAAGYTDDAAALATAYRMVQMYVTEEDRRAAQAELEAILA